MTTPMDDLSPKARELKRFLEHLVTVHATTDLAGVSGCGQCDDFKAALA